MKRIESSKEQENVMESRMDEQFAYERLVRSLDGATRAELVEMCRLLAKQSLVLYPAAMRYMANEAARNLSGGGLGWKTREAERLVELLTDDQGVSTDTTSPES